MLRPRQAPSVRGRPEAATSRRTGGRVTRSSGAQAATNPSDEDSALPPAAAARPVLEASGRSHKRSRPAGAEAPARCRRSKRTRHQSGYYQESSPSDSDEDELGDGYRTPPRPRVLREPPPRSSTRPTTPRVPRTSRRGAAAAPPSKTKGVKASSKKKKSRAAPPTATPTIGSSEPAVIPDWLSLPYYVWVQVFRYAFASLEDREGVNWLLSASQICRAFAEPALTALYQTPPLLTRPMAHNLVVLLAQDPSTTMFNYRSKVEKLRIDVEEIAAKTFRGQPLDLKTLVSCAPRLHVIDFSHPNDLPPFRRLDENLRWHYPSSLFEGLNATLVPHTDAGEVQPTKLTGWRWNRRMMGPDIDLAKIQTLHTTAPFTSLKKLCFVNYQVPSLHATGKVNDDETLARDQSFVHAVAQAINVLPNLEFLSMESSTAVNDEFLSLLPKNLRSLELINCWEITGEGFAEYLLSHGHKLEHLNLHYNQSLNLAFLPVLGDACPNLRTLCVDLKTFNHHEFYHDSEPNYDEVLKANQVPKWPESIETIELRNMKKWSAEAAEILFQSLVDGAQSLPNLRHLDLKAMLDIPIRQRSKLRDKWKDKLRRVFLRKKEDPKPFFSLRQKAIDQVVGADSITKKARNGKPRASDGEARRSSRIAQASGPSSRESSVARGASKRQRGKPMYTEVDTDDDEISDDNEELSGESSARSSEDEVDNESFFRQGMCDMVEILMDNQKPAERILQMDDFLDDTDSDDLSDEDWNGDDRVDDVEYAW